MMPRSAKKQKKAETKAERERREKPQWIKWDKSDAKKVIMDDLQCGRLKPDVSAEKAFSFYKKLPQFEKVCISQFELRLADHRKQVNKQFKLASGEEEAFRKDQKLGFKNTKTHNHRGELILHLSDVHDLLREDVQDNKHLGLTPSDFQSTRPEYAGIDTTKFKERVKYEEKRKKFIFHCDLKRQKKGRKVPAMYKKVE